MSYGKYWFILYRKYTDCKPKKVFYLLISGHFAIYSLSLDYLLHETFEVEKIKETNSYRREQCESQKEITYPLPSHGTAHC